MPSSVSPAPLADRDEFRSRAIGFTLAILAVIGWGFNFVIGRELGPEVNPLNLVFLRWSIAALFLVAITWGTLRRIWPLVREHKAYLVKVGVTGMVGYMLTIYLALLYTPVVNVSLINGTSPVFLLALLALMRVERVTALQAAGCAVATAGLFYLLGEGSRMPWEIVELNAGDLWALASAVGWALYMLLASKRPGGIPILAFHAICVTVGSAVLLPPAAVGWALHGFPEMTAVQWGWILYLGLVPSLLCYWFWNAAISRLGAATTGVVYYLIPVTASLQSLYFLGEELAAFHFVSMAVIIAGVALAGMRRRPKPGRDQGRI